MSRKILRFDPRRSPTSPPPSSVVAISEAHQRALQIHNVRQDFAEALFNMRRASEIPGEQDPQHARTLARLSRLLTVRPTPVKIRGAYVPRRAADR